MSMEWYLGDIVRTSPNAAIHATPCKNWVMNDLTGRAPADTMPDLSGHQCINHCLLVVI
ncbi:MAG: hypothetical protein P8M32_01005 [Phycisphaerales bacterium]|nr:hypothetical protein [Phycisphaerales bacterium]